MIGTFTFLAILLSGFSVFSALILAVTHLRSEQYSEQATTRVMGLILFMNRQVVLADWLFTTPAIIFQPLSGIWLASLLNLSLLTPWLAISLALYVLAGVCWLPVVWLQMRMRDLATRADESGNTLPQRYWQYARIWFWLGVPAFVAMLAVVFLMVFKSAAGV